MNRVKFIEFPDHFYIRWNTETLVSLTTEADELIQFLLPLREKWKIFGSISRHDWCHTEKFSMRKHISRNYKNIYKFSNP